MFSEATCFRLCAPRLPTPIMAMLSFSARLRPRTIVGTASAPKAALATNFPKLATSRPCEFGRGIGPAHGIGSLVDAIDRSVCLVLGRRKHAAILVN